MKKRQPVDQGFVQHLLELLDGLGEVTAKRMFGGWGIYHAGRMFGLVADGVFYVKADSQTLALYESAQMQPFTYDKQGKATRLAYYSVPLEALEDAQEMLHWARLGVAAAQRAAALDRGRRKRDIK